jgi:hypothetical protein
LLFHRCRKFVLRYFLEVYRLNLLWFFYHFCCFYVLRCNPWCQTVGNVGVATSRGVPFVPTAPTGTALAASDSFDTAGSSSFRPHNWNLRVLNVIACRRSIQLTGRHCLSCTTCFTPLFFACNFLGSRRIKLLG